MIKEEGKQKAPGVKPGADRLQMEQMFLVCTLPTPGGTRIKARWQKINNQSFLLEGFGASGDNDTQGRIWLMLKHIINLMWKIVADL